MKKFRFVVLFIMIVSLGIFCSCEGIMGSNGGFVFELASDGNSYIVSKYKGRETDVIIPSSYNELPVTIIGSEAFKGKNEITNIEIPNSVTSIEYFAFTGCSSLTNISFPESVTFIGEEAFRGCTSLTNVVIPESVTNIGLLAFGDCINLESVTIPFVGCNPNFENKETSLSSVFGCENYNDDDLSVITNTNLPESLKEVIITSGTSIAIAAFDHCSYIERIVLPNTLTTIGIMAFASCNSLKYIEIPDSVTSIGNSAFYCCSSLESIEIPDSVTSIGDSAFNYCESLTIYCEAASQPSGWGDRWNNSNIPVYWAGQWEYDAAGNPVPLS